MIKTPFSPKVRQWLKNSQAIRILHLFERSCNLLNQDDELVSLVLPSVGLGPFSLIVPDVVLDRLRNEVPISVEDGGRLLVIGYWEVEVVQTAVWNPIPNWSALRERPFHHNAQIPPLPKLIETRFQQLLHAISRQHNDGIVQATKQLAGLGEGLTPQGDDLLMGVLFALWVHSPNSPIIGLIGETAVPQTTTLSAAFLKSAVDGEATIHWHDLVNNSPNAIQKIVAIGHTSGVAAWIGFLQTLQMIKG